jgi:hypothetical protein
VSREERRAWRRYVYGCPNLTAVQRLVLLALSDYTDFPAGTNARPGVATLAEICGCGTRVVEGALHRGRRLRLIEQTARANPKRGLAAIFKLPARARRYAGQGAFPGDLRPSKQQFHATCASVQIRGWCPVPRD